MKKIFIATVVLLFAFMLSAVEKKVNFVWKDTGRSFSDFRTYSFGFREKGDEYCFAFQIKNLKQLMEDKDSMLVCCMDTDNNEKTGRTGNKKGWDLQFNILLNRHSVSIIVWEENKIQTSHTLSEGEFAMEAEDDILYLTIKKSVYLKKIRFGKSITLFEEHTYRKKAVTSGLEEGKKVDLR